MLRWAGGFGVAVLASYFAIYLPVVRSRQGAQAPPPLSTPIPSANVTLVAGRPANPQFWLLNEGEVTAQKPKHGFLLYDLDETDVQQPRRLLRIPTAQLDDYILPKSALGPWRILDLSAEARSVPAGHHVFGYVNVQCLNCPKLRTFWVFFTTGRAGWFRELSLAEAKVVNRTLAAVIYSREGAVERVDEVIPTLGRVSFE